MALAFTFPGQGSQAPGMGRDLAAAFPAAREVFQEVDETLRQKLSHSEHWVRTREGELDEVKARLRKRGPR